MKNSDTENEFHPKLKFENFNLKLNKPKLWILIKANENFKNLSFRETKWFFNTKF